MTGGVRGARLAAGVLLALPFTMGAAAAPASVDGTELCRVGDDEVVEASGLVATGSPPEGLLVTVNDSGDEGRVFALDAATCETVGVTRWAEEPEDVEALAPGGGSDGVWVADIGDNGRSRDTVRVGLVPVAAADREAAPQWTDLRYPDGPRDAEALLRHPRSGRLVVVSKQVVGAGFYGVPERVEPGQVGELEPLGSAPSLVTDGAFWPDGRHLVVRNYGRATVLTWPGLERVESFALPPEPQGEALAVTPNGRVLVTSEGRRQPVLEVALPADVRARLEGAGGAGGGEADDLGDPDREPTAPAGEAVGPPSSGEPGESVPWTGVIVAGAGVVALLAAGAAVMRRPGAR